MSLEGSNELKYHSVSKSGSNAILWKELATASRIEPDGCHQLGLAMLGHRRPQLHGLELLSAGAPQEKKIV